MVPKSTSSQARWAAAFETFSDTAAKLRAASHTRDRAKIDAAIEAHKLAINEYNAALIQVEWHDSHPGGDYLSSDSLT